MGIKIEFETDGAAFTDWALPESEVIWVLTSINVRVHDGERSGALKDSSGNSIGQWSWT